VSNILIVEPPGAARDALERALAVLGHRVSLFTDGEEAFNAWRLQHHELAIVDEAAPRVSGSQLASRLKADGRDPFVPVILVTARPDPDARAVAMTLVEDAVSRPYHAAELAARADALLRARRLVDDLRARQAESDARAFTDSVTGLRNRLFLNERLGEEWKRAVRYSEPLSLLVLSLEAWTPALDRRGAGFKDRVLHQLAAAMKRSLRQIDLVTRYGVSELGALLINTHLAGSLACADRLRKEVAESRVDDYTPQVVMGISFYPGKDVHEPGDLGRLCGQAVERARTEGPGSVCLIQHQGYLFGG
jgi:diguanylate cyclase (GGDEF)-like protein